ncbi:Cyclin-A3-1, variant 2 [Lathyrus oleraceus]|nr:Cyclin-A3-1, variant 2 [Pisum sativum]
METGGSKKRTNGTESPSVLVPKRQRVVLEEFPDLNVPDYHPNLNKSASTSTLSLLPNSNLDNSVCNKTNAKRESMQIVEPYVSDVSVYLRMMEVQEKRRPAVDYMDNVQRFITTNMRATLVDWLVEVADEYKLLPETLHLAVSYIDRFLSIHSLDRSKLQLLGVSAMLIASKYEEITPPKAVDFCQITDNTYELHEVLEMESHILKSLNFEMGNPNVTTFLK